MARTVLPLLLAAATGAWAAGTAPSGLSVTLVDPASGRAQRFPSGRPTLFVCEDRESEPSNQAAHALVGQLHERSPEKFEVVAVADVAAWNWWPARRFVLAELAKVGARDKTTIWADWKGAFRRTFALPPKESGYVLLDGAGGLRWRHSGALDPQARRRLVAALGQLGCDLAGF